MLKNPLKISRSVAEKTIKSMNNDIWKKSPYQKLGHMSTDERGRNGEEFCVALLESIGFGVFWEGDSNISSKDADTYDFVITEMPDGKATQKKVEVKSSMEGRNLDSWQHDSIKEDGWDYLMFYDRCVGEDGNFYITIHKHSEFPKRGEKHSILQRVKTPCKDGFKFDMMKTKDVRKGYTRMVGEKMAIYVDKNTTHKNISSFINDRLS